MNEIEFGLSTVNTRCGTEYKTPDEVILGAAQLAEKMIASEDVDYEYDGHIMALDLFRAAKLVGPLRSEIMIEASKIWLKRNRG